MRSLLPTIALVLAAAVPSFSEGAEIEVHKRSRTKDGEKWVVKEAKEAWQPGETAIIVCDMWDSHHCLNAVRRAVEMAPRMDAVLKSARERGVLIIHAPSSCMAPYENHPGRKLASSAPTAANLPEGIGEWCRHIPTEDQGTYPIDQKDGGEDDDLEEHRLWHEKLAALGRNPKAPWKSQLASLTIDDRDAISDSGVEIWNLMEQRGIKNVVLLGVHTNMCVLGRPFGLRQLAKNGKNVVLMRDMTDTMYDPAKWPYVNHFTGTHLIALHIEKFVCPTITSVDFLTGVDAGVNRRDHAAYSQPFRFARDKRRIAMLIGDDEYQTGETLPAFATLDLEPLGFEVTIVHADSQDKNHFPGMAEAIQDADLVLVSVRRRLPPKEQLEALRQHVAAGKPVVGIRTASHAWCLRGDKENAAAAERGVGVWPEFDRDVLGGHYTNHHGNGPMTSISAAEEAKDHPILRGVAVETLIGNGSLYKVQPIAQTATPLLFGAIPNQEPEPVAWTNRAAPNEARVFYTSLGHPQDFENAAFRKLLVNGIYWAMERPYPRGEKIDELLPNQVKQ
jgi:nicotinamidase-related amidase/type 1 glutamine amidotransferase